MLLLLYKEKEMSPSLKTENKMPNCELALVKAVQEKISAILLSSQFIDAVEEREAIKKCFGILNSRANEILLFIQLILKVKNELVFAKLDLERTPPAEKKGSTAQRRVQWLEKKLHNISLTCHEKCFMLEKQSTHEVLQHALYDISDCLKDALHEATKSSLFKCCKCDYAKKSKEEKILEKMQKNLKKLKLSPAEKMFHKKPSSVLLSHQSIQSSHVSSSRIPNQNNEEPEIHSREYLDHWNSEYHRFQWHNFQQNLNPRSWRGLATSDCDSFLKKRGKEPHQSADNGMPKITCIVGYQKDALDQLVTKLQTMYNGVENAVTNPDKQLMQSSHKDFKLSELNIPLEVSTKSVHENISKGASHDTQFDQLAPMSSLKTKEISSSKQIFPRSPTLWCDKDLPCTSIGLVQVQNKHSTSSTKLASNKDSVIVQLPFFNKQQKEQKHTMRKAAVGVKVVNKWMQMLADPGRAIDFSELQERKIKDVVGANGLDSGNMNVAVDAARSAGQLKNKDKRIIHKLKDIVSRRKKDILAYECSKSLLLLGSCYLDAVVVLTEGLKTWNKKLQFDAMEVIQKSPEIRLIDKNSTAARELSKELLKLVSTTTKYVSTEESFMLSFEAALCLAHLRVINKYAKQLLLSTLNDEHPYRLKCLALNALVKLMDCRDDVVIDSLLHQMKHSTCCKYRMQATGLLQIIGLKRMKSYGLEKVYPVFEELLWNHPNKEFRAKVANLMNMFGMRNAVCAEVLRKLEDKSELARAEAIIALATLKMKGEKELKILLDIFELDASIYVRTQVIRTLVALQWNHPRVIRALQERQRGACAILSIEVTKALEILKVS